MRYVIRERFIHLGEDSDITDEQGRPVYQVDGKVLSLHNTLIVRDPSGAEVARVERQLVAVRPTYHITQSGREMAEVRQKLFSPFVDRFVQRQLRMPAFPLDAEQGIPLRSADGTTDRSRAAGLRITRRAAVYQGRA